MFIVIVSLWQSLAFAQEETDEEFATRQNNLNKDLDEYVERILSDDVDYRKHIYETLKKEFES